MRINCFGINLRFTSVIISSGMELSYVEIFILVPVILFMHFQGDYFRFEQTQKMMRNINLFYVSHSLQVLKHLNSRPSESCLKLFCRFGVCSANRKFGVKRLSIGHKLGIFPQKVLSHSLARDSFEQGLECYRVWLWLHRSNAIIPIPVASRHVLRFPWHQMQSQVFQPLHLSCRNHASFKFSGPDNRPSGTHILNLK